MANRQVARLIPEQVERFTAEAIRAKPARSFDPQATLQALQADRAKAVIAVDIGGDKLLSSVYGVRGGVLVQMTEAVVRRGDGGSGYLKALEELADMARRDVLPVGISFAGPTDGTKIVAGPNVPVFISELRDRYDANVAKVLPKATVANDAEAGIIAGALEAAKRYPDARNVIYVINGSGLGGAVLKDNMIFAAEPGHIEVDAALNPFGQQKSCGVLGATHVCIEAVAASKAGVEDVWFQQTGERLSGHEIAGKYVSGDRLALRLYDNSALATTHVVKGIASAFGLAENLASSVIIFHGGIFQVPGYCERVRSILAGNSSPPPRILFTKDFSINTCLDGAAIAAVVPGTR